MPLASRKKFVSQVKNLRDGGGDALAVPADLQLKPERLTLDNEIGRGGFAVVFHGTYTSGGRVTDVAYKRIELGEAVTPDDMKMIAREVQLMHSVALHHNVVTLLGACADPRAVDSAGASVSVGLMLEFATRGALFDVLREPSPPAMALRVSLLLDTARGMLALHSHMPRAIVHRDLKSPNVLVFEALGGLLVAKVADFGLAHTLSTSTAASIKTKGGQGSAAWMAPEVYDAEYSEASDVWAFGMVAFEFASRKLPYEGMNATQIMKQVCINNTLPDAALAEPGCPDVLLALMRECCTSAPNARPPFSEIVARLEPAVGDAVPKADDASERAGGGAVDERVAALMAMQEMMAQQLQQISAKLESQGASGGGSGGGGGANDETLLGRDLTPVETAVLGTVRDLAKKGAGEKQALHGICFIVGDGAAVLKCGKVKLKSSDFRANPQIAVMGDGVAEFRAGAAGDGAIVIDSAPPGWYLCASFGVSDTTLGDERGGGMRHEAASAIAQQAGGCFVVKVSEDDCGCAATPIRGAKMLVFDKTKIGKPLPVHVE